MYGEIVEALKEHYCPRLLQIQHERTSLGRINSSYVAVLRALGEHCHFGADNNDMLRDRLVCGVNDINIQRRLLQESDLTNKTAYDIAIVMEAASKDAQDL